MGGGEGDMIKGKNLGPSIPRLLSCLLLISCLVAVGGDRLSSTAAIPTKENEACSRRKETVNGHDLFSYQRLGGWKVSLVTAVGRDRPDIQFIIHLAVSLSAFSFYFLLTAVDR